MTGQKWLQGVRELFQQCSCSQWGVPNYKGFSQQAVSPSSDTSSSLLFPSSAILFCWLYVGGMGCKYTIYPVRVIPYTEDVTGGKSDDKTQGLYTAVQTLNLTWISIWVWEPRQDPPTSSSMRTPKNITTPCTRARKEITRGRAASIQAPRTRNFLCHHLWLRFPKHFHYQWGWNLPQPVFYSSTPNKETDESLLSHSKTSRHQVLHGEICSNQSVKSFIRVTGHKPRTNIVLRPVRYRWDSKEHVYVSTESITNPVRGHDWFIQSIESFCSFHHPLSFFAGQGPCLINLL